MGVLRFLKFIIINYLEDKIEMFEIENNVKDEF